MVPGSSAGGHSGFKVNCMQFVGGSSAWGSLEQELAPLGGASAGGGAGGCEGHPHLGGAASGSGVA